MNIRDVNLKGKEVVEVGSGRGGGASWIAKTYGPKKLIGFDLPSNFTAYTSNFPIPPGLSDEKYSVLVPR
jgi:predicted O-methyltransferase YrrM